MGAHCKLHCVAVVVVCCVCDVTEVVDANNLVARSHVKIAIVIERG